jgi:hypothetical protein
MVISALDEPSGRFRTKAIVVPSADHAGEAAAQSVGVIIVRSDPSDPIV